MLSWHPVEAVKHIPDQAIGHADPLIGQAKRSIAGLLSAIPGVRIPERRVDPCAVFSLGEKQELVIGSVHRVLRSSLSENSLGSERCPIPTGSSPPRAAADRNRPT